MTTMNFDEAKAVLIQAEEAYRQIPPPLRTGLPALFAALELLSSLRPALDEMERRRTALETAIAGVESGEATRQAAADAAFATAQAERLSTVADLNRQIETQRVTLADLAGTLAEAKATIEKAAQLRADVKQRAGAL